MRSRIASSHQETILLRYIVSVRLDQSPQKGNAMDTKYFQQALEEMCDRKRDPMIPIKDLTIGELSQLLRRAQELKDIEITESREARRGTCAWCGRRDFNQPCDSPLGHKLYEEVARKGA